MRGPLATRVLVITAWAAVCGADEAAPPPGPGAIVERALATRQTLRNDVKDPIRVPLVLKPKVTGLKADLAAVERDGAADGWLLSAFTPNFEGEGSRLVITVDREAVTQPATYDLSIALRAAVDARPALETIVVHVVLERATLRAVPSLIFEKTLGILGDDDPLVPAEFTLRETGGRTALAPLTVEHLGAAIQDDHAVVARVVASPAPSELRRGASAAVRVAVQGSLWAGTTRGKLEIRAPQLAEPLQVDYEVRARYRPLWIIPLFLVSGLGGWLLRVWLRQQEAAAAVMVQAGLLRGRLEAERKRNPTDEGARLGEKQGELEAALRSRDVTAIGEAMQAADTALAKAIAARGQRQTELLAEAASLLAPLDAPWHLPPGVTLVDVKTTVERARTVLLVGETAEGETAMKQVRTALAAQGQTVEQWVKGMKDVGDRLLALEPGIAAVGLDRQTVLGPLTKAVMAVPAWVPAPPPAKDWLSAVHDAQSLAENLAPHLEGALGKTLGAIEKAFDDDAAVASVRLAAKVAQPADPRDAAGALQAIADALDRLDATVRKELDRLRPRAEWASGVEENLAAGRYAAAVAVAKAPTPVAGMGHRKIADAGTAAAAAPSEAGMEPPASVTVATAPLVVSVPPAHVPIEVIVDAATERLWRDRLAIGLLTAILSSLAAWVLYRDAWTGTTRDWAGVAVVAFMSDFTIDALLESITKLKKA